MTLTLRQVRESPPDSGNGKTQTMTESKPYRVLSLDGGGMRGVYTASYLEELAAGFARQRNVGTLDVGAMFDLIVGTSVGGINACALAAGVPLGRMVALFRDDGAQIFSRRIPEKSRVSWKSPLPSVGFACALVGDHLGRPSSLRTGEDALRETLRVCFGAETLAQVHKRRGIALAITAVELGRGKSWVFKTAHNSGSNGRDDDTLLVDVCLATSAAPIYRSIAAIEYGKGRSKATRYFVDGGLWANNPVLVALLEAAGLAEPEQKIQVFSLGTCPRPSGEAPGISERHRGLAGWKFGGEAASLAIDAQQFAYDNMARMLSQHISHGCTVVRFPSDSIPASLAPFLALDETSDEAMEAIINQAKADASFTNSTCNDPTSADGALIRKLFADSNPA
ncbi:MAG: patatin [Deltaproteobacteria bacterium]|nr:MAG: patatin [Deltaproteobacteria bacterium]